MGVFVLLGLLLGLLSQIGPVECLPPSADNTRPLILHLNDIYQYNGSYYNGTFEVNLILEDRDIDEDEVDRFPGRICSYLVGHNILLQYNAIATFGPLSTNAEGDHVNPVMLNIDGVYKPFDLMAPGVDRSYSGFQEIHIPSNSIYHPFEPFWLLDVKASTSDTYHLTGERTSKFLEYRLPLGFNLTDACGADPGLPPPTPEDMEDFLFTGEVQTPEDEKKDMWIRSIPNPKVRSAFGLERAVWNMEGVFRLDNGNTELVGYIEMAFDGKLDEGWSDDLLMGKETPEWNITLGVSKDPPGDDSASAKMSSRMIVACAVMFLSVSYLIL